VSSTGQEAGVERGRPRWHNPAEVSSVVDVLRHLRPRGVGRLPSLAILAPYKAQVDKLHERIASARACELDHLDQFAPVRSNGAFVGTVDSFQGSEADVVVLSLVRNNPRTGGGALGFLRDRRRMNVALSRAKFQLIVVGSLAFLREAVRGVNPDLETHDLSFLTAMVNAIDGLAMRKRGDIPLAGLVAPSALSVRL
jgi:superfamily I DNA and/or RNA helicase